MGPGTRAECGHEVGRHLLDFADVHIGVGLLVAQPDLGEADGVAAAEEVRALVARPNIFRSNLLNLWRRTARSATRGADAGQLDLHRSPSSKRSSTSVIVRFRPPVRGDEVHVVGRDQGIEIESRRWPRRRRHCRFTPSPCRRRTPAHDPRACR
jgi:hypothetical protein